MAIHINNKKSGLIVLGMHRSGTSATAGLFSMLGFDAGRRIMPGNQFNPKGYFENECVVSENHKLLERLGRKWLDTRSLPQNWMDLDWIGSAEHQLQEVFSSEYRVEGSWVLKDPCICRLLPLWKKVFASLGLTPNYLFVVRKPAEVVASLQRRDGMPMHQALLLYAQHLLEAEFETRGYQRGCVLYDDLIGDWRSTLKSVVEMFSLSVFLPGAEKSQEIDQFITPSLNHGKMTVHDLDLDGEEWAIADAVFQAFNQTDPFSDLTHFDALREWLANYFSIAERWMLEAHRSEPLRQHYVDFLLSRLTSADDTLSEDLSFMAKSVIYWETCTSPGYEELRCIEHHFNFGQEQSLRFNFPESIDGYKGLRWDITDRAAFCTVQQVYLENAEGVRVWSWKPTKPLFGLPSGDMTLVCPPQHADYCDVLATGKDPHAPLLIPKEIMGQIKEGWVLCARVFFAIPTLAIPRLIAIIQSGGAGPVHTARLAGPNTSVGPLSQKLDDLATMFKATLAARDRDLFAKQQQLDQLREALLRAEAQLDLLKDVLLDQMGSDRL